MTQIFLPYVTAFPQHELGTKVLTNAISTIDGIPNYRGVPRLPVIDTTAFKKAPKEKQGGQTALDL